MHFYFMNKATQRAARSKLCFSWAAPLEDPEVTFRITFSCSASSYDFLKQIGVD